MAEHLEKMREKFPSEFAFYPQTFVLPRDMTELRKSFGRTGKSRRTFIVKPDGGCQGRGIYLTRDFSDIDTAATCVAQHYIHRPFLIENKKFDLRIYVLVTSCKPLRIYLFRDGLVRMCTENFMAPTAENLDDKCMHLTNYAINRKSENFKYESSDEEVATRIGEGSKRTIQWFVSWLRETEGDHVVNTMWSEIGNICAKTVISVSPVLVREYDKVFGLMDMYSSCPLEKKVATSVPKAAKAEKLSGETATASFLPPPPSSLQKQSRGSRCFQILGFDIMIDSQFKPNLIEVNHLPSCKYLVIMPWKNTPQQSFLINNLVKFAMPPLL